MKMTNLVKTLLICLVLSALSLTICACGLIGGGDEQTQEPPVVNETIYKDLEVPKYSDPAPEYNTYGKFTVDGTLGEEWNGQQKFVAEPIVNGVSHKLEMSTSFVTEGIVIYAKVTGAPAYYNPLRFMVNSGIAFYIETDAEPTDNEGPMKIIVHPGKLYASYRYDKRGTNGAFTYNRYHIELDHAYTIEGKNNDPANNGYTVECMIPWSAIGESAAPDKVYINPEIIYCANETVYSTTKCSLASYFRGTAASYTDWYKFDGNGYQICTDGHKYGSYKIVTSPTYEKAGEGLLCCDECLYSSPVNLPAVSEANGYTKVGTGVATRWQYTVEGLILTVDVENTDGTILKTHDFVAFVNDPFIAENGGSISGTVDVTNDTPRYENTVGQTFTTTITVSEDTLADFIIKVENGSKTNTYKGLFSSITLNGKSVAINAGSVTGKGWGNSIDIIVARLELKKGTNVITFTRTTSTAAENNFNIWGVGFITADDVTIALDSNLKTHNFIAFVNDPFIAANGGSISGTVDVTNDTPRYENTRGQTFTTTITVSKDTVADFIIKVENGNQTNTYAGLFSSITLDGTAVTINDGSVTGQGWGNSIDIIVANLNLTKGTHVITFTRTTDDTKKNNYNIWGVGFITPNDVVINLGSEQ